MKTPEIPIALNGRRFDASPGFFSRLLRKGGGSRAIPTELTTAAGLASLRAHDLTPWIYLRVKEEGWQKVLRPEVMVLLRTDYLNSLAMTMAQENETHQVLTALASEGFTPILLKGADLRLRVYEHAAARTMIDLDLLISREEAPRAGAVFQKLGYRPAGHYNSMPGFQQEYGYELTFTPPEGKVLTLDLHWEVRGAACLHQLTYEPLRARALTWEYRGMPVLLLAPEHLLLHLCLHAFSEAEISLRTALDLALVITRLPLDWDRFREEVYLFRSPLPVAAILGTMGPLYPGLVPVELLAELAGYRPSPQERLVLEVRRRLRQLGARFPLLFRHRHLWEGVTFILARLQKKS